MSQSNIPAELIQSADDTNEEDPTKLTLAYERLYELPRTIVERFADHIRYLDISHNKITNLDALVHFKHLTSLIADDNPITENCFLPPMPKLQLLWLNRCKISSLYPWVGKLKESCPALCLLSLMGNPAAPSYFNGGTFYDYLQYRLFVISQFPSLRHLDDRAVAGDQRAEARRLYRRPLLERLAPALAAPGAWGSAPARLAALWRKARPPGRNLLI
ncbi:leucine-rich melanocyte differentiation-associated protein-like isoform X2 [Pararge aegeria]|nr:leucine-rich melanocyte differentiation-associated protein-like isoform X2 [Pararge aegeria]